MVFIIRWPKEGREERRDGRSKSYALAALIAGAEVYVEEDGIRYTMDPRTGAWK